MRSRWLILALVVLAQLMVVLDATIVNIALPSAQADLGFSNGSRQWIVTGYALAFGSLLPLGGRIGDVYGRKRALVIGSLGTALLNTIAVSATTAYLSSHRGDGDLVARGIVHGYTVAFWWSAGIFAFGALVCGLLLPGRRQPAPAEPVPVAAR